MKEFKSLIKPLNEIIGLTLTSGFIAVVANFIGRRIMSLYPDFEYVISFAYLESLKGGLIMGVLFALLWKLGLEDLYYKLLTVWPNPIWVLIPLLWLLFFVLNAIEAGGIILF